MLDSIANELGINLSITEWEYIIVFILVLVFIIAFVVMCDVGKVLKKVNDLEDKIAELEKGKTE